MQYVNLKNNCILYKNFYFQSKLRFEDAECQHGFCVDQDCFILGVLNSLHLDPSCASLFTQSWFCLMNAKQPVLFPFTFQLSNKLHLGVHATFYCASAFSFLSLPRIRHLWWTSMQYTPIFCNLFLFLLL